jgi:hypothetical protein
MKVALTPGATNRERGHLVEFLLPQGGEGRNAGLGQTMQAAMQNPARRLPRLPTGEDAETMRRDNKLPAKDPGVPATL